MRKLPAAFAFSAVLHVGAIAWVHARSGKLQPPPAVTAPIEITVVDQHDPPPMAVTLLDDHTVTTIPAVASSRAPSRATSHHGGGQLAHAESSTGHASGTDVPSRSGHSDLMTMRGPEIQAGLSPDFTQMFLSHDKPLAPEPAETGELQPAGRGYKSVQGTFTAQIEPDGSAHFKDDKNLQIHGLGATFDTTDWMMRRHGIDPYASNKLRFLDKTRDERARIGQRYHHEQLLHSTQLVQKNLERLWASRPDLAARKQGLFDLWDECAETGDPEIVEGGRAARTYLVGFIRAKLTGAGAYTADDLARLNAHRQSKAAFAPY